MIFRLLLVVNEEIVPYPSDEDRRSCTSILGGHHVSRKLTVALIAVNKQIRLEASAILYGSNTWRITCIPEHLPIQSHQIFLAHPRLFRHIVMSFHFQDYSGESLTRHVATARQLYANKSGHVREANAMTTWLHEQVIAQLHNLWGYGCVLVSQMDLKTLMCDITSCYCHIGCCRLPNQVEWYQFCRREGNMDAEILITGTETAEEEHFAFDAIVRGIRGSEAERLYREDQPADTRLKRYLREKRIVESRLEHRLAIINAHATNAEIPGVARS